MTSITPISPSLAIGSLTLNYIEDYTVISDVIQENVSIVDAEMVFVGYMDYKGVVKDKIVVALVNEQSASQFAGDTLTCYGKWTDKFEQARIQGARGVLLIHTNQTAGYGWQVVTSSFAGEQVMLEDSQGLTPLHFKGWISEHAAHKIAELSGNSLDGWIQAASNSSFTQIPLQSRFTIHVNYNVRHFNGTNVVARLGPLPDADTQAVVLMAHHDHLGIRPAGGTGSNNTIYNGAVDNASGVAALLSAAYALGSFYTPQLVVSPGLLPAIPRRTVIFLSLTGGESNLLGSTYFTSHPPGDIPLSNVKFALNLLYIASPW
jgi:hypothetical protein